MDLGERGGEGRTWRSGERGNCSWDAMYEGRIKVNKILVLVTYKIDKTLSINFGYVDS